MLAISKKVCATTQNKTDLKFFFHFMFGVLLTAKKSFKMKFEFFVRLHGEYNYTSLALWKHHVNLLLQSFRP